MQQFLLSSRFRESIRTNQKLITIFMFLPWFYSSSLNAFVRTQNQILEGWNFNQMFTSSPHISREKTESLWKTTGKWIKLLHKVIYFNCGGDFIQPENLKSTPCSTPRRFSFHINSSARTLNFSYEASKG